MSKRMRIRRMLTLLGLVTCIAIFLVSTFSLWWSTSYFVVDKWKDRRAPNTFFVGASPIAYGVELSEGCAVLIYDAPRLALPGWHLHRLRRSPIGLVPQLGRTGHLIVPAWLPFLIAGLPTVLLWWWDKSARVWFAAARWERARAIITSCLFLLWLLSPILWWISLNWQVTYAFGLPNSDVLLVGAQGGTVFAWKLDNTAPVGWSIQSNPSDPVWFAFREGSRVMLPLWIVFVVLGGFHTLLSKYQRVRGDVCIHCGYSLTGNTSGVCPECGTAISSAMDTPAS